MLFRSGAEAYEAVNEDGLRVGGAIITANGNMGELALLYVKVGVQKKEDIIPFIEMQRSQHNRIMEDGSNAADQLTSIIKADKTVSMGMINEIKQELRQAGALRIFYNAAEDAKRKQQQK